MNNESCLSCEHCDPDRTNDLGETRCTRFSTFTKVLYSCDYYTPRFNKALQELAEKLKRSDTE